MKELRGRVAVVTGGGSGIGRGMARAFAEAGMAVVVADVEEAAAARVAEELTGGGAQAMAVRVDVSRRDEVESLAETVYAEHGAAHLLCNNAGVAKFGLLDQLSDDDWRWVLSVNLDGVIHGLQAFLPRMRRQEGEKHVVNTASSAGIGPFPALGPYVASKYAVVGISETLRLEGQGWGLSCSVLCPGNVDTEIVSSGRNRPDALGGPDPDVPARALEEIREGLDPDDVGRITRQGVIDDDLYIFTHPITRTLAENRFRAMLEAQDKSERR